GELCRGVRAGSPHPLIWYDIPEQHASAREWPRVVDGDRCGADICAHRVARAELTDGALRFLERFPFIRERSDVGRRINARDVNEIGGARTRVSQHATGGIERGLAG